MATIRIEKSKNFSIVSNELLRDKRLSLRTRGLLVFCLSLADTWEYSVKGLAAATGESEGKISLCLKELEKYGYLTRERTRNAKGQLEGVAYTLWEKPQDHDEKKPNVEKPILDNPVLEKPVQEKPNVENRGQINTNKNNNKYKYNNKTEEELKGSSGSSVVPARAREQTPDPEAVNRLKSGEAAEALVLWQNNFGTLSPLLTDNIVDLVCSVGIVAFKTAVERAILRNKRGFNYVRTVAEGIASGDDWGDTKPPEQRRRQQRKNDVVANTAEAQRILESGELIDL